MKTSRRRHEVRDDDGVLVAVIDIVGDDRGPGASMIELAADVGATGYRVRIFGQAPARRLPRAA